MPEKNSLMIYQIYYDEKSLQGINVDNQCITPCGVHKARNLERMAAYIYDDEKEPNLTKHNTLCEWRALYYVWKHYPSEWVGFTSWQHDLKKFVPAISQIKPELCASVLKLRQIAGFYIEPLPALIPPPIAEAAGINLKTQFVQYSVAEEVMGCNFCDTRDIPLGRYHRNEYWNFVINEYRALHGSNLEKDLDFETLGQINMLHTWCNAFVANWDYFNDYMTHFSPIVLSMLDHFGSHPTDLELAYICERLIILHNYIKYTNNEFVVGSGKDKKHCNNDLVQTIRKKSPSIEISIITCSVDDGKFNKFKKNARAIFGRNLQLIRINDAKSIAEGFNRGIDQAHGEILIFCHDDIEFLNGKTAEFIKDDLKENDIVGVAGTSLLAQGKWISVGQPFMHGQVIHKSDKNGAGYNLCVYGLGRDDTIVCGIQALDGLFFAVNRDVLDKVRFDERLFDGFHLYDLDFTYAAYLKGARIIVDHRIHLLHQSVGNYDHNWKRYADRFNRKYINILPTNGLNPCILIRGIYSRSKDTLAQEMKCNDKSKRIYLQKMPAQSPGEMQFRIESEDSNRDMDIRASQRLPFPGDSINYLYFQFRSLSDLERNFCFREIFRLSRHGAVTECVRILPEDGRDHAPGPDSPGAPFSWPKEIRLSNDNKEQGALLLMGTTNDGAMMSKAYFQICKKVAT